MPTWSPDDREIAFASTREDGQSVWAVNVADGTERKVSTAAGRVDAPSWGPGGQIVYHVTAPGQSRFEIGGKPLTGAENVFAFRASWASPTDFFYVSDGKIRKRSADGGSAADDRLHRDAAGDARANGLRAPQARLHLDHAASGARHRPAGDLARRQADRVRRARRHLRDAGRRQAGQPHQGSGARHRSGLVARRLAARLLVGQGQRRICSSGSATCGPARAARSRS